VKKVVGYKKRPWWITGFSFFFVFLPLIALALKLHQYEPSQLFNFKMWIEVIQHFEVNNWLLVFLSLSIGFLIFNASKLSLIIVSALFLFILIINLVLLKKLVLWSIIIPILFWFSPFRRPYLNRALRWWEQLPRFWIQKDQDSILVDQKNGRIINLSLSGVLVESLGDAFSYNLEDSVVLSFAEVEIKAKCKRSAGKEFAFQFEKMSSIEKRKLKQFVRTYREDYQR
jgi:hypothetical protein